MTEPAGLTLALLGKVDACTERMAEDLHDLKVSGDRRIIASKKG